MKKHNPTTYTGPRSSSANVGKTRRRGGSKFYRPEAQFLPVARSLTSRSDRLPSVTSPTRRASGLWGRVYPLIAAATVLMLVALLLPRAFH